MIIIKVSQQVTEPLYPIVCSTAAKTEMALGVLKRDFLSLQVLHISEDINIMNSRR